MSTAQISPPGGTCCAEAREAKAGSQAPAGHRLRESEARYRELAELSTDWYWESDEMHRFVHISLGLERNLGLAVEDAIGKTRWELDSLNMTPADWAAHRKVLESREPFRNLRVTRRNRAGRLTYQSVTGRPRFDAAGRFLGYRGVGHDVTAQTQAEFALRAERDRLSHIIETMAEGLVILDARGNYGLVNASAEQILGAPRQALIGRHFLEVPWNRLPFAGSDAGLPQKVFAQLRDGKIKTIGPSRYVLVTAEGRRKIISHHAVRVEDDALQFNGVIATMEDITELHLAEQRLAESELQFRSLFELSQDGIAIFRDGVIEQANRAMAKLLGAGDPRELIGRRFLDLNAPEYRAEVEARIAQLVQGASQLPYRERRLVRLDGGTVAVETAGGAFREGESIRMHVVARDLTARKAHEDEIGALNADLERRVEQRTAELAAAYREMESFSYSVSHDLRAPLGAISGFSQIVMADFHAQIPPEARRLLTHVVRNAERMGMLIDGLLDFGRLSRQPIRRQRIETTALVREVLEDLAPAMHGREAQVRLGPLPDLWGDRTLLKQVFANLLGNALKYTARRPRAEIEIGSSAAAPGPVCFVRDNGAGFDMAHAAKLFDMFERLHSASEFEGNGVGLALVRRIVERHGGKVWADAAPERGATFFFQLGAQPGSDPERVAAG